MVVQSSAPELKNSSSGRTKCGAVSDELIVCTDDGSHGRKALVTVPLKEMLEDWSEDVPEVWAIGPAVMMKYVSLTTRPF